MAVGLLANVAGSVLERLHLGFKAGADNLERVSHGLRIIQYVIGVLYPCVVEFVLHVTRRERVELLAGGQLGGNQQVIQFKVALVFVVTQAIA
ncbi:MULTISPECIES: hypothetical protein [Cupriavidus]